MKKKPGRNDPCPCGSGKKFKKCCESTMLGGRYQAAKIDTKDASIGAKVGGLTSFFQQRTAIIPRKTDASDPVPPLKRRESEETKEKGEEGPKETDS